MNEHAHQHNSDNPIVTCREPIPFECPLSVLSGHYLQLIATLTMAPKAASTT